MSRKENLADRLRKAKNKETKAPHLIVEARAGTGKTTTLIEGLKIIKGQKSKLTPSPQQKAVWKAMELSKGKAETICFVAFNKSIATELQERVPEGCDAMTMHSMGFKAIQRGVGKVRVNNYRVQDIVSEILGKDIKEIRRYQMELLRATEKLVGLCKMNLIGIADKVIDVEEALSDLAAYYDVDVNGDSAKVFDLTVKVLNRCKEVEKDNCIDFNDMIWLPVVLDLNVYKYDLLLVDEAQDLNRCQQALAKKAGRRLILCGDPKQAIYGFAGADSQSMSRLEEELSSTSKGCIHLPLTVTRRCGKVIVNAAKALVPDLEAHDTNPPGIICHANLEGSSKAVFPNDPRKWSYRENVQNEDMIICRCNAPLVSECFKFLKEGRKANIQGRDVGQGLISTIKKLMKGRDFDSISEIGTLYGRVDEWYCNEERKENARRNPRESRLINLQDRRDCLHCFTDGAKSVTEVIERIECIFTDDKSESGIRLSSVHKAKGLEADNVFILIPKDAPMPHPMAKSKWEQDQELNIKYVAITRTIHQLTWVS